jgi:hypothetical protein
MEKEQMVEQAKEHLTPFETGNIIDFIQHLTLKSAMDNPVLVVVFLGLVFYAVVKRSKLVLLFLFTVVSIVLLIKYTLSPEILEGGLTLESMLPFVGGGVVIGIVFIYFAFIQHD